MDMRIEKDSLGEIEVEEKYYWGSQTQRTILNFPHARARLPDSFIKALAKIKKSAAQVNHKLGKLEERRAHAICSAADEVIAGKLNEHFPLSMWQSGSGTQTNMNMNEVLANRADELIGGKKSDFTIHPNDHVNMSQSTNDVFSTAMQISTYQLLVAELLPALNLLEMELVDKSVEFNEVYKIGRTHLMDAVPMSVGKEFEAWSEQIIFHKENIQNLLEPLSHLPIGGTAVGSGINAGPDFAKLMVHELSNLTDHPFKEANNKYSLIAAHDPLVNVSGALKNLATALMKIANDIRLLASGPRCGLGELRLPANEPGSSIMPGKVNPTQCELLTMICCMVIGNDMAISVAASHGQFQLNAFKPLMIDKLIESIASLSEGCFSFTIRCVRDIKVNKLTLEKNIENSLMVVTVLSPHIGYDRAARVAFEAYKHNTTIKEEVISQGILSEKEYNQIVNLKTMIPE